MFSFLHKQDLRESRGCLLHKQVERSEIFFFLLVLEKLMAEIKEISFALEINPKAEGIASFQQDHTEPRKP